ncbi:hypothetical protein ACDJ07_24910, partial [Enterobacter kobei]|uniref:hypothetical protein n=1 Tax=Enterobacter kobei TaxID=208224 RepID=UPI003598C750
MKNTIHINFAIFLIIANIIYSSASASTDISTVASPLFEGTEGNDSNLLIVFYIQIMPDDF